jgi:shikimate kinase
MEGSNEENKNKLIEYLIENSIFTKRQIEIIYRRIKSDKSREVSRGAYYRVLLQARENIRKVFYSIILLEILGIVNNDKKMVIERVTKQLELFLSNDSDIDVSDVIYIIDNVMRELSKV